MAPQRKNNVIVIGAGVIGLQTALTLLEEGREAYNVYVVAELLPGDESGEYASAWAGAQWRSHETSYTEAASWDAETYNAWKELLKKEKNCGLAFMTGVNYWTTLNATSSFLSSQTIEKTSPNINESAKVHAPEVNSTMPVPWWSTLVDAYRPIEASSLPPDVIYGAEFKTFTIDPAVFLPYLLQKVQVLGGRVFRSSLRTDRGLEAATAQAAKIVGLDGDETVWAVVNATGLGATRMVGDKHMYPIRGQTVLVKGTAKACTTKLGATKTDVIAVMPRPRTNCTVVGVTIEEDVWETAVEEDKVPYLLNRSKQLAPELLDKHGNHEILKVGVGLRPGRKGGARVELEDGHNGLLIAHTYGNAGAGYQNSIGCARKVLRLLDRHEKTTSL